MHGHGLDEVGVDRDRDRWGGCGGKSDARRRARHDGPVPGAERCAVRPGISVLLTRQHRARARASRGAASRIRRASTSTASRTSSCLRGDGGARRRVCGWSRSSPRSTASAARRIARIWRAASMRAAAWSCTRCTRNGDDRPARQHAARPGCAGGGSAGHRHAHVDVRGLHGVRDARRGAPAPPDRRARSPQPARRRERWMARCSTRRWRIRGRANADPAATAYALYPTPAAARPDDGRARALLERDDWASVRTCTWCRWTAGDARSGSTRPASRGCARRRTCPPSPSSTDVSRRSSRSRDRT